MAQRGYVHLLCLLLLLVPPAEAATKCSASGFYPPGNASLQVFVEAFISDSDRKITPYALTVGMDPDKKTLTALGTSHGLQTKYLAALDVHYGYLAGSRLSPASLELTGYFPSDRHDLPKLQLVIGKTTFSAQSHRGTVPRESDVYAEFAIPSSQSGLYHPGESATFIMVDPVSGAELARANMPLPTAAAFQAALKLAMSDLATDCQQAEDNNK